MNELIKKLSEIECLIKEIKTELVKFNTNPENGALNEAPFGDSDKEKQANKALYKYEQLIGLVTPAVVEGIDFAVGEGMVPELIIRIIEYACEQGKRNWQYINACILGNLKENILTLDAYNRHQAERAERSTNNKASERIVKRSKFNNYEDSNKKDYSKMQEEILKGFME